VEVSTSYLGSEGKAEKVQHLVKVKRQAFSEKPDDFFTFSGVGLDVDSSSDRTHTAYWLFSLNAGILLIISGILLKRRLSRIPAS
jgi:hypothetical protein